MTTRTKAAKLKGDGRYTDAPRFQVIFGYEDSFKDMFKKVTVQMTKDIIQSANVMVRKK